MEGPPRYGRPFFFVRVGMGAGAIPRGWITIYRNDVSSGLGGGPKISSNVRAMDKSRPSAPPGHMSWRPTGSPPASPWTGVDEAQSPK